MKFELDLKLFTNIFNLFIYTVNIILHIYFKNNK